MGSGKSAVGRELAAQLGWDIVDLDLEIQLNQGKNIPDIFKEKGEIYFRKIEAQLLRSILSSSDKLVLSSGGGTPCYGGNMEAMLYDTAVKTIYLKCSLDVLTERLWPEREARPLIAHLESKVDLNDFIRKHLFERSGFYLQSEIIVTCDEKSPEAIAAEIVKTILE